MMRFLASVLYSTVAFSLIVPWSRTQMEEQIDKMQEAVFNSPGTEAPVPPQVFLAGGGFLTSQFLLGRLLGLSRWQSLLSGLIGIGVGILFTARRPWH